MNKSKIKDVPVPIALLMVSFVIPVEFSVSLGGLHLNATRLVLLMLAILIIFKTAPPVRKQKYDYALIAFVIWVLISLSINHSILKALENGGATGLEILVSYFSVKYYIKNASHVYGILKLLLIITIFILPLLIIENFIGRHFIHEIASSITGVHYPLKYEERLGLTRAYGPFSHPILSGVFFSSMFGIFWYGSMISKKKKILQSSILISATFTSLSSAPILVIGVQVFAIFWNKVTASFRYRWKFVFIGVVSLYIFLMFYSDRSPLMAILSKITIDSSTAYYRTLIWDYGINNILNNPLFGIGLHDWVRPDWMPSSSVDNFWLLRAMRYGLPAILFLVGSIYFLMKKVNYLKDFKHLSEFKMISLGWLVSMISFILVGFTVDFFGNNRPFFFFILGLGAAIFNMQKLADREYQSNLNDRHN